MLVTTPKRPKKTSRKLLSNPSRWVRTTQKNAIQSGQEYVSKNGKVIPARTLGPVCDCISRCGEKITQCRREILFKSYWATSCQKEKWDYLARFCLTTDPVKRTVPLQTIVYNSVTKNFEKNKSRQYYLDLGENKKVKVCKKMFLQTFGIKEHVLKTIDTKRTLNNSFLGNDMRGSNTNKGNKIPQRQFDCAKAHIKSFPRVESHYCRADTGREYFLEENLNLKIMYDLYLQWLIDDQIDIPPVSISTYRRIFNYHSGNIGFNKPKKDQCEKCKRFMNLGEAKTALDQVEFDNHMQGKNEIRKIRDVAILDASKSKSIIIACFDLEKIFNLPQSNVGILYYKRKLKIMNFTIYDMFTHQGYCYVWNETEGKKGANEISSALLKFIEQKVNEGFSDFRFFSDSCGGQNKNQHLFTMFMIVSAKYNIKISLFYFEVGHSQSSGDSMHSAIERKGKNREIFTQEEWLSVIKAACDKKPYIINEMNHSDIFDFHKPAAVFAWKRIKIQRIREIVFSPENLKFRYDSYSSDYVDAKFCNDEEFKKICESDFNLASQEKICLDKNKIKDIESLIEKGIIAGENNIKFYKNLYSNEHED